METIILKIGINEYELQEIPNYLFATYGIKLDGLGAHSIGENQWEYYSIKINNKFYAPKINLISDGNKE